MMTTATSVRQQPTLPWHISLEQWCQQTYGFRRLRTQSHYEMAPIETYRPELHHRVPVVVLVLTAATRGLHYRFAQAVELIRASTYGFRPVLVTDTADSPAVGYAQWPIEQVPHERSWYVDPRSNWLELAAKHVDQVQSRYSAQYVLAPETQAQALEVLRLLSLGFDATPQVQQTAAEIMAAGAGGAADEQRVGARGPFTEVPVGRDQREVMLESGATVELTTISRAEAGAGSGGVLVSLDPADEPRLARWAEAAGVNVAILQLGDPWAAQSLSQQSAGAHRELVSLINAAADALAAGGPALLVAPAVTGALSGQGQILGLSDRLMPQDCAGLNGSLTQGEDSQLQLLLTTGGHLTFPEPALPRVLAQLTTALS